MLVRSNVLHKSHVSPHSSDRHIASFVSSRYRRLRSLTLSAILAISLAYAMGDFLNNGTATVNQRPGVMIVRPTLHEQTEENAATFKRWTVMHFQDLLSLSQSASKTEGISRAIRYTNTAGELFYTIHVDNISILKSSAYYAVSRRLDLENTRNVENGEEAVLPKSNDLGLGVEPMIWQLVNAEFGIFQEHMSSNTAQDAQEWSHPYQSLDLSLVSSRGASPFAPPCLLVTLTFNSSAVSSDEKEAQPPQCLLDLQISAISHLASDHSTNGKIYSSIYRHIPGAQPDMHPTITKGADGNGVWVVCILIEGKVDGVMRTRLKEGLDESMNAIKKRDGETNEGSVGWDVKMGIWEGELFVS